MAGNISGSNHKPFEQFFSEDSGKLKHYEANTVLLSWPHAASISAPLRFLIVAL
jgi:hypothetical protein